MLPDNLGYLFDDALRLRPSAPAILQGDAVLSYGELDQRVNRAANLLRGVGVGPGDRVALMFGNDVVFLELLFGAMRIGAVAVPLNIRQGEESLSYVLSDADAAVLVAGGGMERRAAGLRSRSPGVRCFIAAGSPVEGALAYEGLMAAASPELDRRRTDSDDACLQPYTSGSTGRPKGVVLSHRGQIWNTDALRKACMLDDTDRALVAVPLFHKNAMLGAVKPFLLSGGSIVILPGFEAVEVIRAIDRYRVTYLTGVPAMYKLILAERAELARHDVSSVRYALVGSAEVPQELLDEFQEVFGAPMAESYGLTEGGPVPLLNTRWGLKKRGSCGLAFPGSDVRLVGDDGTTEVPADQVGELVVRNPGVALGYWKRPEEWDRKYRDGWLSTGDLMRRDQDGYYYFVGRKDDMINVSGENVYPKEVEDVLLRHPGLRDACVVPAPHPIKGEVPVAFVVAREAGIATEEELRGFFLQHGAPYAYPRRIVFLEAMPLSGTGKIDRNALRAMARALTLSPADPGAGTRGG